MSLIGELKNEDFREVKKDVKCFFELKNGEKFEFKALYDLFDGEVEILSEQIDSFLKKYEEYGIKKQLMEYKNELYDICFCKKERLNKFYIKEMKNLFELFFKELFYDLYCEKDFLDFRDQRMVAKWEEKNITLHLQYDTIYQNFFAIPSDIYCKMISVVNALVEYDISEDNTGMLYFENQGFSKKGYSEFFFENETILGQLNRSEKESISFYINDIEVNIKKPSKMFNFLFHERRIHGHEEKWGNVFTISFEGLDKENEIENFLQQIEFYISNTFPKFLPQINTYEMRGKVVSFHREEELLKLETSNFPLIKLIDPVCFYNKAMNQHGDDEFINYYRVLEYFFNQSRDKAILDLANKKEKDKGDEEFITELKKLTEDKEVVALEILLKDLQQKEVIKFYGEFNKFIDKNKKIPVNSIARELYKFRNLNVHSKEKRYLGNSKDSYRVPKLLNTKEDVFWFKKIKFLAKLCIDKYCY